MKVRKARESELDHVYLMGYDVWGAELPQDMYLDSCKASYKYRQGEFWVLEDENGKLLSSCIVYPLNAFGGVVSERAVGIGSLATAAGERHKGLATYLLAQLMESLENDGVDAFFIHSDIHPKIYQRLGFVAAPQELRRRGDFSVPMLRLQSGKQVPRELWGAIVLPAYF